jgi:hypothetical protein
MGLYVIYNAAMATTAAMVKQSTGTAIRTMHQVATPSTNQARIHAWGYTLDDPPGADAVIELIQTDVAATGLTAHVASGVQPVEDGAPAALFTLGTGATGYAAAAPTEGAITATRTFDVVSLSSVSGESLLDYRYQFMPRERPVVPISKFLRVRATIPTTAVDMLCWVKLEQL